MITKAVILARGLGTRMQKDFSEELDEETKKIADSGIKALIPIKGRPFLDYSIDNLIKAGFKEICLVIAPDSNEIKNYYKSKEKELAKKGVKVVFVYQEKPIGTANALLAAKEFTSKDKFCMLSGDNLYSFNDLKLIREEREDYAIMAYNNLDLMKKSNIPEERIKRFGIIVLDKEGNFDRIVEKPANPSQYGNKGNILVSMSCYLFSYPIYEACEKIEAHPERKEFELPTAIAFLVDNKKAKFKAIKSNEGVLDLTGKSDIENVRKELAKNTISW